MNHRKTTFVFVIVLIALLTGCARRPVVLITGYWPPTNDMLIPLSDNETLNPAGWQGKDWKGLGYDVYAYFPTFEGGTKANPQGAGDFQVDYQDSWDDFQRITDKLKPTVIVCYGLGAGPWEIERNAVYLRRWGNDYHQPTQPTDLPRGDWRDGQVIPLTLPAEAIRKAVAKAIPDLNVWIDREGNPGDFLCNYMALLAADYQMRHNDCHMAGFIHVGAEVNVETARRAHEITLSTILREIKR